jgi:hypothetical protein
MIQVTLAIDAMGDHATAEDVDVWFDYVGDHIEQAVGFPVRVVRGEATTYDAAATAEQRQAIYDAIQDLWDDWCAAG